MTGARAEELSFRLAAPADAAEIVRVVNAAYRVEDFFKIGDRTDEEEVLKSIRKHRFILAEDHAGVLAGCVEVRVEGGRGYFGMLSVEPGKQKTGLGAALIARAEQFAGEQGCDVMDLTYVNVREELPGFYRRYGYRETGTTPWNDHERTRFPVHFVTMSKALSATVVSSDARPT